jgi:hypothetical protein
MHTISLFVVLHEEEWVELKVTKEGDIRPERNYKEQACPRIGYGAYSTRQ